MSWNDEFLQNAYNILCDAMDSITDIADWAEDEGYRAILHKLEEAGAPLASAIEATKQYDDGRLEKR